MASEISIAEVDNLILLLNEHIVKRNLPHTAVTPIRYLIENCVKRPNQAVADENHEYFQLFVNADGFYLLLHARTGVSYCVYDPGETFSYDMTVDRQLRQIIPQNRWRDFVEHKLQPKVFAKALNIRESAELCFVRAVMIMHHTNLMSTTTVDVKRVKSFVYMCLSNEKLFDPSELVIRSSVTLPEKALVSIPLPLVPQRDNTFAEFARMIVPSIFKKRKSASSKHGRTAPVRKAEFHLSSEEDTLAQNKAKQFAHTRAYERAQLQARETVEEEVENLELRLKSAREKLLVLQQTTMSETPNEEEFRPSSVTSPPLTLDDVQQTRVLRLRTTSSATGTFDIRVKMTACDLAVNHSFSSQQICTALRTISNLLGFVVDVPDISTVSRWREVIVPLVAYDSINALLGDDSFLAMETDGTSMKLSKSLRSKIQTTRLNSSSGGATFPCVVLAAGDGKTIAEQFIHTLTESAKIFCHVKNALDITQYDDPSSLQDDAVRIVDKLVGRQGSILSDNGGENRTSTKYYEAMQEILREKQDDFSVMGNAERLAEVAHRFAELQKASVKNGCEPILRFHCILHIVSLFAKYFVKTVDSTMQEFILSEATAVVNFTCCAWRMRHVR